MATYTKLKDSDLEAVQAIYGLSQIKQIEPFQLGSKNSNFRLDTEDASYVLTISDSKAIDEVRLLVNTLRHLEQEGFWTTRIIPTCKGEAFSFLNGKPLLLKSFLHGEVIDPIPIDSLKLLGEAIGRLHKIPSPDFLPRQVSIGIQSFRTLRDEFAREHPFLDWLETVESFMQEYMTDALPKALIHADIFADNVIHVEGRGPVIMDFEEATVYYRVFDLGMTLVGTCRQSKDDPFRVDSAARNSLLSGYTQVIQMQPDEERALKAFTVYAAAAMASWRFRQFNILYPELGRQEHYRELQLVGETEMRHDH